MIPVMTMKRLFTSVGVASGKTILSATSMRSAGLFLCLLASSNSALAADALVRLVAEPESPWVGQKVVLKLDVLAADGWAQLKKTGGNEIKGGYLLRFESQGTRLSETIEGISYSGQRYEFLFFAQRGGAVTIPEMAIDVEVKTWGADSKTETTRLMTPTLNLSVREPPGTGQLDGLISTTDFSATQKWTPTGESFTVGDAIVREISLKAADVTGMAFLPLSSSENEGISTYLSEPAVEDSYNRGTLVGKRQEKLTYVFERGGSYVLPELSYHWWNTSAEKLETITLTGLSVEVQVSAAGPPSSSVAKVNEFSLRSLLWVIGLLTLAVVIAYRYRVPLLNRVRDWQRAYHESEKNYFRKIKAAVQQGDTQKLMCTIMQWLDRLDTEPEPARLDRFLNRYSDAAGWKVYDDFVSTSYAELDKQHCQNLYDVLAAARSRWQKEKRVRKKIEILLPQVGLSTSSTNNIMDH